MDYKPGKWHKAMQIVNVVCSDVVMITFLQLTSLQACTTRLSQIWGKLILVTNWSRGHSSL